MFELLNRVKRNFYLSSQISIVDNCQLIIENCKNVMECNENLVRVLSNDFIIEIWGEALIVTNYSSNTLSVKGKLKNISINERRKIK